MSVFKLLGTCLVFILYVNVLIISSFYPMKGKYFIPVLQMGKWCSATLFILSLNCSSDLLSCPFQLLRPEPPSDRWGLEQLEQLPLTSRWASEAQDSPAYCLDKSLERGLPLTGPRLKSSAWHSNEQAPPLQPAPTPLLYHTPRVSQPRPRLSPGPVLSGASLPLLMLCPLREMHWHLSRSLPLSSSQ